MAADALTDVPRSSEEWRAFLQRRVASFGRTLASFAVCERAGVYDVVKVLDFGLVKELGGDTSSTTTSSVEARP